MSRVTILIFVSFFPACLLILRQAISSEHLSYSLLAIGLFLLAIDQARMADLDLRQVMIAKVNGKDRRLNRFFRLTLLTIITELAGFYLTQRSLGWGIQLVLFSQLMFNGLATIQLQISGAEVTIITRSIGDRLRLIMANGIAMSLMGLWMAKIAPLAIVSSLWAIAIAYASLKIWRLLSSTAA